MPCGNILTGAILNDCDNAMVAGIEVNVLMFNHSDIDKSTCTFSVTNKTVLTNFQLKPGKTGYLFEGVKQVNALKSELAKKEFGNDKHKHTFTGVILQFSAENKKRLMEFAEGGKIAVIVELKWKGAGSTDAFQIGGFDSGLELQSYAWATNENDGTVSLELASSEGYEESRVPLSILETSYLLTATAFGNKFIQPAV